MNQILIGMRVFTITLLGLIHIIGFSQQQLGQIIEGKMAGDDYGNAISLSGDGTRIAIGSPFNDLNENKSGHVGIYEYNASSWMQIGEDILGSVTGYFGAHVELSRDGKILAVGSPYASNGMGEVQVYQEHNGEWIQMGSTLYGETNFDQFGWQLSISANGKRFAVGASKNASNGIWSGVVKVFEWIDQEWIQIGDTFRGEYKKSLLGEVIGLSNDGKRLAYKWNYVENGETLERVSIYEEIDQEWQKIGADLGETTSDDFRTSSLNFSEDGKILVMGAMGFDGSGEASGQVRSYIENSERWSELALPINGPYAHDLFGIFVKLNPSGNQMAVGSYPFKPTGPEPGYVNLYRIENGNWIRNGALFSDAGDIHYSATLSDDFNRFAHGMPNVGASGKVIVSEFQNIVSTPVLEQVKYHVSPNPTYGIININFIEEMKDISINIRTLTGQNLYTIERTIASKLQIELHEPPGVYMLEIFVSGKLASVNKVIML